ncbi:MAG TPA: hypothetical protein ENJ87_00020 [Gammaproteobacteria bacterium]|nr:hypothetical protein [Gammaproteobacteria bacterium]
MKTLNIIPLVLSIACISCGEENRESSPETFSALEGKWKSQCFPGVVNFNATDSSAPQSFRVQHIFKSETYDVTIANYSDNACSSSGIEVNAEDWTVVSSFPLPTGFTINNEFITDEGDSATEIDFLFNDGSIKKDIYLQRDNTLYFGLPAPECLIPPTNEAYLLCNDIRPGSINFGIGYAQSGEPTVIVPDIFPSTGEPPVGTNANFDFTSISISTPVLSDP